MSDLQLDLGALSAARRKVDDAQSTFESAGTVGSDLAALTGESRLAGKVRDFADNWEIHRGQLLDRLQFVRGGLDAIIETMTELDDELARQADEAAPETSTETGSGDGS